MSADDDDAAQIDHLTQADLDRLDARTRRQLHRLQLRLLVAYLAITLVFVAGLWSYRRTLDHIEANARQDARQTCLAMNQLRSEVVHLGDVTGDPRIEAYLANGLRPTDCSVFPE